MWFFNQVQSAILFTTMRITLQLTTTYLITQILSRTYNLTYMERTEAGLLSKLPFVFMTRYSNANKHFFGRFWILLMVFINVLLTGLPPLLNKLYPVQLTMMPTTQIFNITIAEHTSIDVILNATSTSEVDLSSILGFPLGAYSYDHYSISAPKLIPIPWQHRDPNLLNDFILQFGFGLESSSPAPTPKGNTTVMEIIKPTNLTYFNITIDFENYLEMMPNWNHLKNIENYNCGFGYVVQKYCLTYRISYYINVNPQYIWVLDKKDVFIMPSFLKVEEFDLNYCMKKPTPSLRDMCNTMTAFKDDLGSYMYRSSVLGVQSITNITNGVLVEAVWISHIGSEMIVVKAVHSEHFIATYEWNPGMNGSIISDPNYLPPMVTFTTMYMNISYTQDFIIPPFLMDKGFPLESVQNITNFILRGMSIFGGSLMVSPTSLVATVPEVLVVAVFAVALLCMICGYIATRSVDPMVTHPLSEIIAASRTNTEGSSFRRNVVHLTLARSGGISRAPPTIFVDSMRLDVENDELQLLYSEE